MTSDFWQLIESTRPERGGPSAHAEAITSSLVDSGREAILQYAAAFDAAIDALYAWDLWGAAYLSFGGCSDDAFEYVRAWIIGAGEAAWEKARTHPESLFVDLLDGTEDPDGRWDQLGIHDGEHLLYAAGVAYERLVGEGLPGRSVLHPSEPAGDEWNEDELPALFPELYAALPDDWWGEGDGEGDQSQFIRVMIKVETGVVAFLEGDHAAAMEVLESLIDDHEQWTLVADDRRVDVAHIVGIGRLLAGDVEGASTALRLVETRFGEADHARRAFAQVELARGDLESASRWIDQTQHARRLDRALAAKLAWRLGETEEAIRRATAVLVAPIHPDEHPWDAGGSTQQAGQIFVEAGDATNARKAAHITASLLVDAPADLPLVAHHQLLMAAVARLEGRPEDALAQLEPIEEQLGGAELAECLREQARANGALGRGERSVALYLSAVEAFEAAGERWEADATRGEAGL